jgi:hypothetical protein
MPPVQAREIKTIWEESQQEFLNEIRYIRDVGATLEVALEGRVNVLP